MRTCVNLLSAEIKFAAGTASFLREGLGFPHKKPFAKLHTRSISVGGIEPRLRRPPTSRTEVLNPAGASSGGVRILTPTRREPLIVYPTPRPRSVTFDAARILPQAIPLWIRQPTTPRLGRGSCRAAHQVRECRSGIAPGAVTGTWLYSSVRRAAEAICLGVDRAGRPPAC
jgi:hypothetical protein